MPKDFRRKKQLDKKKSLLKADPITNTAAIPLLEKVPMLNI